MKELRKYYYALLLVYLTDFWVISSAEVFFYYGSYCWCSVLFLVTFLILCGVCWCFVVVLIPCFLTFRLP